MSYVPPPPGSYGPPPPPPPPPKRGHTLELLVGGLLGAVDLVGTGFLGAVIVGAMLYDTDGAGWAFVIAPVLGLLIPIALLFKASTRWWGVGILLGYFLTLIVIGGACALLIAGLSSGG